MMQAASSFRPAPGANLLLAMLGFVIGFGGGATPLAGSENKEPKALAVLERADAAIRQAGGIAYAFEYLGTGANLGRVTGTAAVRRIENSRRLAFRAELDLAESPPGFDAHPRRAVIASDGHRVWRRDDIARRLERASLDEGGSYLTRAFGIVLLPQWPRDAPFGLEIDDSEIARHAGVTVLDGVECDVIFLRFSAASGLGDQWFSIGREDALPRRVTMVTPGLDADTPTWHFELRLWDVRTGEIDVGTLAPNLPEGYQMVDADRRSVTPGAASPDWRLETPEGTSVSSTDLRGKVVLLDFWASWCPFCTALLPGAAAIRNDYADREVAVYAVNIWDRGSPIETFRERGIDLPILIEGDAVADLYKIGSTPNAVVVGRDGRIVHREHGTTPERDARLRAAIDEALATGD